MKNHPIGPWFLPKEMSPDEIIEKMALAFRLKKAPLTEENTTYFDTHDWRLYKKNYLLSLTDQVWQLTDYETGKLLGKMTDAQKHAMRFARDFTIDPLKTNLQKTLGVRRLLPLAVFKVKIRRFRILNADQKTTANLEMRTWTLKNESTAFHTVNIIGVRGYEKRRRKLFRFITRLGVTKNVSSHFFYVEGAKDRGRRPGDYTSKFSIQLDPDISTREAAVAIFKTLLTTMRANEDGIVKDIDAEFLHDFRVAMRRSRSGLSQIKGALPLNETQWIMKELALLGKQTGPTRDLDVYLSYEEAYLARLPPGLQNGLTGFFNEMAQRRQKQWQKMVQTLISATYQKMVSDWQTILDGSLAMGPSKNADRPIEPFARTIIFQRYKRIIKKGRAIHAESPDERLHQLRIQCKKLRYSLEFFTSLFPEKEMARVIRQLKKLQNLLGDFNDLSVQQEMLDEYLRTIRTGSKKSVRLAAALGGLQTVLGREKKEVRERFETVFGHFSCSKYQHLFAKLFGKSKTAQPFASR